MYLKTYLKKQQNQNQTNIILTYIIIKFNENINLFPIKTEISKNINYFLDLLDLIKYTMSILGRTEV